MKIRHPHVWTFWVLGFHTIPDRRSCVLCGLVQTR